MSLERIDKAWPSLSDVQTDEVQTTHQNDLINFPIMKFNWDDPVKVDVVGAGF